MITDARVFRAGFVPSDAVHRHPEINALSAALRPVTRAEPTDATFLFGATAGAGDASVAGGGGGRIYGYDGWEWTAYQPGSGGAVFERAVGGWTARDSPATGTLHGVALDATGEYPDVAVGADGTIVERGSFTATASPNDDDASDDYRYRMEE